MQDTSYTEKKTQPLPWGKIICFTNQVLYGIWDVNVLRKHQWEGLNVSKRLWAHPCAAGKSQAAAGFHCSSVSGVQTRRLAAISKYLPQRDHSSVLSDFSELNIEVCLVIGQQIFKHALSTLWNELNCSVCMWAHKKQIIIFWYIWYKFCRSSSLVYLWPWFKSKLG